MSHITLHYVLSDEAQRAELGAGRPAHREREFKLEPTTELAKEANIDKDGNATIEKFRTKFEDYSGDVSRWGSEILIHEADHVLSNQEDALAFLLACDAAVALKQQNLRAAIAEKKRLQAERDAESARHRAERDAVNAVEKAAREEREAHEAEAKRRFAAEVQDWAAEYGESRLGSPELKRAARERRDVVSEVRRLARERVRAVTAECLDNVNAPLGYIVDTYESQPRDGVPSREAYALVDAIKAALPYIARESGLPDAKAEVSDIMRHDVAPKGDAVWRTGVTVTVSHPWLANAIEVDVISEPLPEEEESEEY